ncbi:MAG TPA: phenylalanine--tRNA ligase subunit beta [Bacteroidales bacterium]|nr:phenylalanine--tRNA ligase subunit beta [Bacteroidales bacterium]
MKISYNWLKNYINCDLAPQRISEILTSIGLEVEALEKYENIRGGLNGIVVGHVVACEKHPNADKLSVTKVDVGNGELLTIVCGAPNVAQGQKVPVALIGTTLYKGEESFTIKEAMLRGVKSQGMICAEDEIGLGDSHAGIMVLDSDLQVGTPLSSLFNVYSDVVFEIGLTPNRIDAASHYGVARDLAAYLQHHSPVVLEKPNVEHFNIENNQAPIEVVIENNEACQRYSGIVIKDIEVKESPDWLKNSLKAIGLRPINNVVDVTNYVLHEIGQPLHAFDYDKIKGQKVIIKTLNEGTSFVTLDGVERKLSSDDLMICNEVEPMCMAGVFGGLESGVNQNTKNIFIESAYFNPVYIRKTARRHGLSTDSSFRFERGADPNITLYALKRAAMLIQQVAGGTISSEIKDVYPKPINDVTIELEYAYIEDVIGKQIPKEQIKEILQSLEIKIVAEKEKSLLIDIPTYRVDVTRPIDVVEEILRIYGFNEVEISDTLNSNLNYSNPLRNEKWYNQIADLLIHNGFYEIMTNSLTKVNYYKDNKFYPLENAVQLLNPLSQDLGVMRQTLLFSGLESVVYNLNRQMTDVRMFELGKCYYLPEKSKNEEVKNYVEETNLALFVSGNKEPQSWLVKQDESTFFFMKRWVDSILTKMNIEATNLSEVQNSIFSYGLNYFYKNDLLVQFGKLSSEVLALLDIKQDVFYAEFKWEILVKLASSKHITFSDLPKFPAVRRDLAMILDKSVKYEQLKRIAQKTCGNLLKEINLFDVYEGKNIEPGKKSYALSFILQSNEKTLLDEEINNTMNKLMKNFETEVGAVIRM